MWEEIVAWVPFGVGVLLLIGLFVMADREGRRANAARKKTRDDELRLSWWRQHTTVCQPCGGTGRVPFAVTAVTASTGRWSDSPPHAAAEDRETR